MGSKTNRSMQAKHDKAKCQRHPAMLESAFKASAFEYAQEKVTVPGPKPGYWVEQDYDTRATRRSRLAMHCGVVTPRNDKGAPYQASKRLDNLRAPIVAPKARAI